MKHLNKQKKVFYMRKFIGLEVLHCNQMLSFCFSKLMALCKQISVDDNTFAKNFFFSFFLLETKFLSSHSICGRSFTICIHIETYFMCINMKIESLSFAITNTQIHNQMKGKEKEKINYFCAGMLLCNA